MNIPIEQKKAEAIARMHLLRIFPMTIKQFTDEGKVSISEPPLGAFYWLEGEDLEQVRAFEKEYDALVYMAVKAVTPLGVMDSYLFVSDHREEWENDRTDLRYGETCAYVYNRDMPDCSEIGYIGIERTPAAGLRRTW